VRGREGGFEEQTCCEDKPRPCLRDTPIDHVCDHPILPGFVRRRTSAAVKRIETKRGRERGKGLGG
jgi:hypothetical protein